MIEAMVIPFAVMFAIVFLRYLLWARKSKPPLREKDRAIVRGLQLAGLAILALGLATAAVIYVKNPPDKYGGATRFFTEGGTVVPDTGPSKADDYQLETMGGKSLVLVAEISVWWHGRKLAYSVAALSVAACLLCFLLAHLQSHLPTVEEDSRQS